MNNTGEPFGLPPGTVRGIIALAFTATLIQQTVIGSIDTLAFLGVAGPFVGFYVAQRGAESAAKALAVEESVAAPATGEVEDS